MNPYTHVDLFGPGINFQERFARDYDELSHKLDLARQLKLIVVMTQGGYDLRHPGHDTFLELAKIEGSKAADKMGRRGCILLVAVDTDEGIQLRKNQNNPGVRRPLIPGIDRARGVAALKPVDLVTLDTQYYPEGHERQGHSTFGLVGLVKPDIYVASETSYEAHQLQEIKAHCPEVIYLPAQGRTSSTGIIRDILLGQETAHNAAILKMQQNTDEILDDAIGRLQALKSTSRGGA